MSQHPSTHLGSLEDQISSIHRAPLGILAALLLFLRKQISELETQVESLGNQISPIGRVPLEILAILLFLRKLISEVEAQLDQISPIRRVPLEILTEIFYLSCCPDSNGWRATHNIIRFTSILSRVCVAWRKAAHATPRLWSTLCLNAENYPKAFSGQVGWLKEWVYRCRGRSLDLYLAFPERKSQKRRKGQKLFHSILRFSHKIRLLDVSGPPSSYLPLIDHSPFPLLEELDFGVRDVTSHYHGVYDTVDLLPPQKINALLAAPKLRRVGVAEDTKISLLTVLMLPAEQLTSLRIKDFYPSGFYVNLLHRCENLVNLKFERVDEYDFSLPRNIVNLPICLPSLKSLSLYGNLLECLTAPHLEELTFQYVPDDFHTFSIEVAAFQQRSRTALSTIDFEHIDDEDEDEDERLAIFTEEFIAMLSLFPTVKNLGIRDSYFNGNFLRPLLRALTVNESGQVLLPKLEYVSLQLGMNGDVDWSLEVKAFILSRWWPEGSSLVFEDIRRLQKVTLGRNRGLKMLDITSVPLGLIVLD